LIFISEVSSICSLLEKPKEIDKMGKLPLRLTFLGTIFLFSKAQIALEEDGGK